MGIPKCREAWLFTKQALKDRLQNPEALGPRDSPPPTYFCPDLVGPATPGASCLAPPPIQTDSCLGFRDPGDNPDLHHFLAGR